MPSHRQSDALHQGLLSYALTQLGLIEGEADCKPADGLITAGEWLGYAANVVPHFLESAPSKPTEALFPSVSPCTM